LPATHCRISKNRQECNWLQGLKGGIDTAHAPILYRRLANDTGRASIGINANTSVEGASTVELETTDYGFRFMGIRNVGEKEIYVRGYDFVMSFHQFRPRQVWYRGQPGEPHVSGHMWVPMDDGNCMSYSFSYSFNDEPITEDHWSQMEWGHGRGPEQVLPDFRTVGNLDND
jgi:hypothetical protein